MGFKQSDLRACAVCTRGMMHAGLPLFYRLRVERFGIDMRAVQRQHGLEMMMGQAAPLAAVMGPNDDIARVLDGPRDLLICETCTHDHPILMQVFLSEEDAP